MKTAVETEGGVEEPDGLTPRMLRALDQKMDRVLMELRETKQRLTAVEIAVGNYASSEMSHYGSLQGRMDRLDDRLDRIERRLELTDAPLDRG